MAKLLLTGEINEQSLADLFLSIRALEEKGAKKLNLHICSGGGEVEAALAMAYLIRTSSIHVIATNIGEVASAALLVYLAAHEYKAAPFASFMYHAPSCNLDEDDMMSHLDTAAQLRRDLDRFHKAMAYYSGAVFWAAWTNRRRDIYFDFETLKKHLQKSS